MSLCSELLRLHEPLLFDFTKGELHFYAAYFEDRDWNRAYAHIQKAQECMQRALMPAAERREWSARIAETKENLLSVLDEVKAAEQQQEAAAAAERAGGDAAAEPATAAPASPTAERAEPSQAYSLGSGIVLTKRPCEIPESHIAITHGILTILQHARARSWGSTHQTCHRRCLPRRPPRQRQPETRKTRRWM